MACTVNRNTDGKITRVNNRKGEESTLFNIIASHPLVENSEVALNIYKNIFTGKADETSQFTHKTPNGFFTSYKESLQNTEEGDTIEIGFYEDGDFTPVIKTIKDTNKDTERGFINSMILENLLSDSKVKAGTEYFYQPQSKVELDRIVQADIVQQEAFVYLGTQGVKRQAEYLQLEKTKGFIKVLDKNGNVSNMNPDELDTKTFQELDETYENAEEIVAEREYNNAKKPYGEDYSGEDVPVVTRTEEQLQNRLLSLLNKMGVKVVSISNYVTNYNKKHGVNPSARALADISEQIIALQEGTINLEDLTEETAHFIVEALPKAQTENILRNIHKSEEWKQFAASYREIYKDEYKTEEELDQAVRREVLGKIVANSLRNQVDPNISESQRNFFTKALELVQSFIDSVVAVFKPQYKTELESYLKDIEQLMYIEDISNLVDTENFKNNKFRLYSVPNNGSEEVKTINRLKQLVEDAQDKVSNLIRAGVGSRVEQSKLESLQRNIENNEQIIAINGLISIAKNEVKKLSATLKAIEKGNVRFFSTEEDIIYQNLIHKTAPTLAEIRQLIEKKKNESKEWANAYKSLESVNTEISDFRAKSEILDKQTVERMVDEIMEKHNVPLERRESVKRWIEEAESDVSLVHATFGQLIHARDGMVNLIGTYIRSLHNDANIDFINSTKNLQKVMRENSVTAKDFKKFFKEGYVISEYDHKKFENVMDWIYAHNYKEVTGVDFTLEDIVEKKRKNELDILDSSQASRLRNLNQSMQKHFRERVYKEEYYTEYEKSLGKLSEPTKRYLGSYNADMSALRGKALEKVGGREILNFQNLSFSDREHLKNIQRDRAYKKSYIDPNGNLKKGLEYVRDENGDISKDENGGYKVKYQEGVEPSESAIIAYEINNIDSSYNSEELEKNNEVFYENLSRIDKEFGREEALNFLKLNAYISFTQDFWDSLSENKSLLERLKDARDNSPENYDEISDIINNITDTNIRLRSILKVHQQKNNPTEIDVQNMDSVEMDTIKTLQESLSRYYSKASQFLEKTDDDAEQVGVSEVNESYLNDLESQGLLRDGNETFEEAVRKINGEISYARNHMTDSNRANLADISEIEKFREGKISYISQSVERLLNRLGHTKESLIENDDVFLDLMEEIVRSKLLPYYKRFTPPSYNNFFNSLGVEKDLVKALKNSYISDTIEITPNYSFFDKKDNSKLNENYNDNYRGGYLQPKLTEVTVPQNVDVVDREGTKRYSMKFLTEKFGDNLSFKDTSFDAIRSNQSLSEVYDAFIDYYFNAKESMNMGKEHNYYLAPQARKQIVDRISSFAQRPTINSLRNAFKDFASFTEDDMETGDSRFGQSTKTIPKRYVNRLEDPSDVSEELFYSATLLAKEAYLRKARVKYAGDIMSVYNKMLTREYNGKEPASTNAVKMAKSAIDYSIHGIKEVRSLPFEVPFIGKVDAAKIARNILDFIKLRNLGLNVIIPMTSYMTGAIFQKIEVIQRDYLHKRSQKLGTAEYRKISADSMKEFGKIDTKAKLNVLGQYFRAFDIESSLKNSNYGWVARALPRAAMALHSMANFPIYGKTLIGVLHDYRVVGDEIINYNSFKNRNQDLSQKDLDAEWAKFEDSVLYQYIDVKNGEVQIDKETLSKKLSKDGEDLDNYIKTTVDTVQQYTATINEYIDGQMSEDDRVYAQRDAILNYFMTHRGWLSVITSRRFKQRHENLALGVEEEGTYRSAWNMLGNYLKEFRGENIASFIRNGREAWNKPPEFDTTGLTKEQIEKRAKSLVELQQRNVKRVMIELAIMNSIMVLGFILKKLADDDENKDIFTLQASAYLTMRTINEMSSTQLALGRNYAEVIEAPFVGWATAVEMTKILDLFSGEEVKYGNYKGMTERERWVTKSLPGFKSIHDLQNMSDARKTYYFYNRNNFKYSPLGLLPWDEN